MEWCQNKLPGLHPDPDVYCYRKASLPLKPTMRSTSLLWPPALACNLILLNLNAEDKSFENNENFQDHLKNQDFADLLELWVLAIHADISCISGCSFWPSISVPEVMILAGNLLTRRRRESICQLHTNSSAANILGSHRSICWRAHTQTQYLMYECYSINWEQMKKKETGHVWLIDFASLKASIVNHDQHSELSAIACIWMLLCKHKEIWWHHFCASHWRWWICQFCTH